MNLGIKPFEKYKLNINMLVLVFKTFGFSVRNFHWYNRNS